MKKIFLATCLAVLSAGMQAQQALTLAECLDLARTNNRTLQNAALELKASGEQKREAWANYLPQISANVLAFQTFDKVIKGDGTYPEALAMLGAPLAQMAGTPYSYSELSRGYSANLSAIQPLYAGGKIRTGNKLAQVGEDVAYLQQHLKEKDVLQKVTECFWQMAMVKYNLQTLDAADRQLEAVQKRVQECLNAGVTTQNALLQVKLRQKELASNRLKLENAQHLLSLLLAQQIGLADTSSMGTSTLDIVLPSDSTFALPQKVDAGSAVTGREEYQLASKGVEAQELQVKMERGNNLPTVAVGLMGYNMGFGGLSKTVRDNMHTNLTNGLVLGTVSIPISSWIGGRHAIRRQQYKLQESRNTLLDAQEQLAIDIESAWSNLSEAYKQIEIARASVEEAKENLRMYMDQYNAGTVTITDLLDAETLNRKAQDDLSSARATYQIRLADYERKVK